MAWVVSLVLAQHVPYPCQCSELSPLVNPPRPGDVKKHASKSPVVIGLSDLCVQ